MWRMRKPVIFYGANALSSCGKREQKRRNGHEKPFGPVLLLHLNEAIGALGLSGI